MACTNHKCIPVGIYAVKINNYSGYILNAKNHTCKIMYGVNIEGLL